MFSLYGGEAQIDCIDCIGLVKRTRCVTRRVEGWRGGKGGAASNGLPTLAKSLCCSNATKRISKESKNNINGSLVGDGL